MRRQDRGVLGTACRYRWLGRAMELARLDFDPSDRRPSSVLVVTATVASVTGSLLSDAVLVAIGEAVFPATRGYAHFQFSDYAKLTVIGVLIACVAWPVVTRVTSSPRWVFFRTAIVVTVLLWLPDLFILVQGQPARAVGFLMLMHLAIALITYNLLVHVAPCRKRARCHAVDFRPSEPSARSKSKSLGQRRYVP